MGGLRARQLPVSRCRFCHASRHPKAPISIALAPLRSPSTPSGRVALSAVLDQSAALVLPRGSLPPWISSPFAGRGPAGRVESSINQSGAAPAQDRTTSHQATAHACLPAARHGHSSRQAKPFDRKVSFFARSSRLSSLFLARCCLLLSDLKQREPQGRLMI
jgi:hypothetical protein